MNEQHISDRDLRAAFVARAAGAPGPDLAARISAEAARTRQSRGWLGLPDFGSRAATQLAWAAILGALTVALIGVLALGVGGNDPNVVVVDPSQSPTPTQAPIESPSTDPSVAPSPSEGPSDSPSPDPSEEPSGEPSGLPFVPSGLGQDGIGRVVATDGLRVRGLPTVGEESERREPLLDQGVTFFVVDGPVLADGYAWYQIDPYGGDQPYPFGWVAAGSREGEAWIAQHLDGCDSVYPSIEMLAGQPRQESIYCYGSDDLELTGMLHCEIADVDSLIGGPDWIEYDRYCTLSENGVEMGVVGKAATVLLDAGSPVDGRYTVVGHFDDPAATECVSDGDPIDGPPSEPASTVLVCRMQFVITEVTPAS
jgi:hypothetical protein